MDSAEQRRVEDIRADLQHLVDLWDLLPGAGTTGFWHSLAEAEHDDEDDDYFVNHVRLVGETLRRMLATGPRALPAPSQIQYITQYVLMFFDRDDTTMANALDPVGAFSAPPGRTGRRWMQDVSATAWRLYVPARAASTRE